MATFRDPKSGQQFIVPDEVIDDYAPRQVDVDPPVAEDPVPKARAPRRRRKAH